jgi:hypothetical protein
MASIPACVYIAEVSDQSLRDMLVTWPSIGISAGILVVYILGAFLKDNWRLVAGLSASFPILTAAATLALLPESRLWLLSKGRDRAVPGPQDAVQSGRQLGKLHTLSLPQAWKPLLVLNGYFFFQQFCGIYVVVYYAVDIVLQAGVSMDEYVVTVLLGVVQLVAGIGVSFALTRQVLTTLTLRSARNSKKKTPWSESASELYRPSNRRLSAK